MSEYHDAFGGSNLRIAKKLSLSARITQALNAKKDSQLAPTVPFAADISAYSHALR